MLLNNPVTIIGIFWNFLLGGSLPSINTLTDGRFPRYCDHLRHKKMTSDNSCCSDLGKEVATK